MDSALNNSYNNISRAIKIFDLNFIRNLIRSNSHILSIYFYEKFLDQYEDVFLYCKENSIPYFIVNSETYKTWRIQTEGILAILPSKSLQFSSLKSYFQFFEKKDTMKGYTFVVLDCIQGAGNFGAIVRTCNHLGADAIIIPKNRSVDTSSKEAFKASSGVLFYVPHIVVPNICQVIQELKKMNFWIYGLDMNGSENIWNCKFPKNTVLVSGNEAVGMRDLTRKNCDFTLSISNYGIVDSLNVSVATAIALSEIKRQKYKSLKDIKFI